MTAPTLFSVPIMQGMYSQLSHRTAPLQSRQLVPAPGTAPARHLDVTVSAYIRKLPSSGGNVAARTAPQSIDSHCNGKSTADATSALEVSGAPVASADTTLSPGAANLSPSEGTPTNPQPATSRLRHRLNALYSTQDLSPPGQQQAQSLAPKSSTGPSPRHTSTSHRTAVNAEVMQASSDSRLHADVLSGSSSASPSYANAAQLLSTAKPANGPAISIPRAPQHTGIGSSLELMSSGVGSLHPSPMPLSVQPPSPYPSLLSSPPRPHDHPMQAASMSSRPHPIPPVQSSHNDMRRPSAPHSAATASAMAVPARRLHSGNPHTPADAVFSDVDPYMDAYDSLKVAVSGRAAPGPIQSFNELRTKAHLKRNLLQAGYHKPTPIQKHAYNIIEEQRDLLACAPTGTGKTGSFLIPIMARLMRITRPANANRAHPTAIILSPTRELAIQLWEEVRKLVLGTHIKTSVLHGGVPIVNQVLELRGGVDILIATPGRLLELVEQKRRVGLARLQVLVVDEVDRMLDLGFEPSLRRLVSHPELPSVETRQTLMYSATLPTDVQRLAAELLRDYVYVAVGAVGGSIDLITQRVEWVAPKEKLSLLAQHLDGSEGLTLVFTNTMSRAAQVHHFLAARGISVSVIHADISQVERDEALQCFRFGVTRVLIATGLAARGLDVPDISHVINLDMPAEIDEYIHRIGRTGRAGRQGIATTFFTGVDAGIAAELMTVLGQSLQEVPDWLSVVAQKDHLRDLKPAATQPVGNLKSGRLPYGAYLHGAHATSSAPSSNPASEAVQQPDFRLRDWRYKDEDWVGRWQQAIGGPESIRAGAVNGSEQQKEVAGRKPGSGEATGGLGLETKVVQGLVAKQRPGDKKRRGPRRGVRGGGNLVLMDVPMEVAVKPDMVGVDMAGVEMRSIAGVPSGVSRLSSLQEPTSRSRKSVWQRR